MTKAPRIAIRHVSEVGELSAVPANALDALQSLGTLRTLEPNQTLQVHGDPITHASLILSGTLVVGLSDAAGRCHILRPITTGQFLNLLPVFDRGPAIHDVHASESSTVMLFEAHALTDLCHRHPALHHALLQILHYRNRLLYAELANIALLPLRQRCAQLLLQVMQPAHTAPDPTLPPAIKVSQTELAHMLGYTRPVVNRELRRLADEGVLDLRYLRIRVADVNRLQAIALGQRP